MDVSSEKNWSLLLVLSLFFGNFGVDRFYLGKVGTGTLKLVTFGGFGIWWLIDIILIASGNMKDRSGHVVRQHSAGMLERDSTNNQQ